MSDYKTLLRDATLSHAALAAAARYIVTLRQIVYASDPLVIAAARAVADEHGAAWYRAATKAGVTG
jgi:hypothetical protein